MTGASYAYRETDDGREIEYRLEWRWTRPRPETRWEPAEGGLEPIDWHADGEHVGESAIPADVVDELVSEAHWQAMEARYG